MLRHALVIARGNRGSSLITFFTADGQLRHAALARRRALEAGADIRTVAAIQERSNARCRSAVKPPAR